MSDSRDVRTFCRVCEPSCGLVARIEDGKLTKLTPDRDHPVSEGFACHKGLAMVDLHNDPDRLDQPGVRSADGTWHDVSWDEAMATIVGRLDDIRGRHGASSVAAYIGNPTAFNALGQQHIGQFLAAAGIRRTFSSGTQDCANKFVASEAVFGSSLVHPIPDLDRTDLCLVIGENPRASQASFYSVPNVLGKMKRAASSGARFVFVNPRRIETPEGGIGDTVQLRPDTDVWFLASLLHEIDSLDGFDRQVIERHGSHVAELRDFISRYPAERTEAVTGVAAATVRELARAWVSTPRASVHASTGINMGRQGTLAYWLVHMLSFVTGRLDVDGGNLKSDGFFPNAVSGRGVTEQRYVETEFGRLRAGNLPGTLMADAILDADEPVRAMFVWAGNPLLSIAGQERLAKAFEQLELLVVVDIYPSATSELAHVRLPGTDMYEREDLNIVNIGTSYQPFAQFTPAVVEPRAERRPEWWIAHRLIQELGGESLLDTETPDPWGKWAHLLRKGADVELETLRATSEVVVLDRPAPGSFYDQQVQTEDGRVDCCPPAFAEAIDRCEDFFSAAETAASDGTLHLIHKRDVWMHNTWMSNLDRMHRSGRTNNPLGIDPADAARLALADGDEVIVTSDHGSVTATIEIDDSLMSGVVSMVHGWGHSASPSLSVASTYPGTNPNALLPSGPGAFEPLSSQAHMTGIPVRVSAGASAH
ncbi:MAG: molybdopterin-dependent oxidoreductase [Acidimicrobiales bacterium]